MNDINSLVNHLNISSMTSISAYNHENGIYSNTDSSEKEKEDSIEFTSSSLSDMSESFSSFVKNGAKISENGMVNMMLTHIFGCLMSERDEIRAQKQIPSLFFSRLKSRIERNEDTGLLPQGGLELFNTFDDKGKDNILKELKEAIVGLIHMPNLGKVISISACEYSHVNFLNGSVRVEIPSIVQSNSGPVIVCPIWTPENGNTASADIYGMVESDSFGRNIVGAHVWNIKKKSVDNYSLNSLNDVELQIKKYYDNS